MTLGRKKVPSLPKGCQDGLDRRGRKEVVRGYSALIWAPPYSCGPGLNCCALQVSGYAGVWLRVGGCPSVPLSYHSCCEPALAKQEGIHVL